MNTNSDYLRNYSTRYWVLGTIFASMTVLSGLKRIIVKFWIWGSITVYTTM